VQLAVAKRRWQTNDQNARLVGRLELRVLAQARHASVHTRPICPAPFEPARAIAVGVQIEKRHRHAVHTAGYFGEELLRILKAAP